MKFCPKCGASLIVGNNNCPSCGELLNSFSVKSNVQPAVDSNVVSPLPAVDDYLNQEDKLPNIEPLIIDVPKKEEDNSVTVSSVIEQKPIAEETEIKNITLAPETKPTELESPMHNLDPKVDKKVNKEITPEEKEKNFNKTVTIVIIVVSIFSLFITTLFLIKLFISKEDTSNIKVVEATRYSYEGFEFFLPVGTVSSVENDEFIIRDIEDTWSAVITIEDGTYNSLISNKGQIKSYFEDYGYIATDAEEKEISGIKFVTTEVLIGNKNVLVAYAKASGTKIYGIIYTNELGTYDDYSLKAVGEILASAVNNGYDTAMPEGFSIDMFKETFEVAK